MAMGACNASPPVTALAREPRFAAPSVSTEYAPKPYVSNIEKGVGSSGRHVGPRAQSSPGHPKVNSSPEARKPEPNLKLSEIVLEAPVAAVPSEGYVAKQNRPKGT